MVPPEIAPGLRVVDRVEALAGQEGSPPDMVLRWNAIPAAAKTIDLVLHLHGYAEEGPTMDLAAVKLPISGLDFADPDGLHPGGRGRPTLGILPRGRWFGGRTGRGYDFPVLAAGDGVRRVLEAARGSFAAAGGRARIRSGRRILTAHSGGAAALAAVIPQFRPHEIHVFDGLYAPAPHLAAWAEQAVAAELAGGRTRRALRVLYVPGTGTESASLELATTIERSLREADGALRSRYRVEAVAADHATMPRRHGWRLLADASADLAS
jgi:hypothetical protein